MLLFIHTFFNFKENQSIQMKHQQNFKLVKVNLTIYKIWDSAAGITSQKLLLLSHTEQSEKQKIIPTDIP